MGREDLSVTLYYCGDVAPNNVFLIISDGIVFYDYLNGIDLLGLEQ